MAPFESVHKLKNPMRALEIFVDGIGRVAEVVDEDVEVGAVAEVVGGGEGAEAAAEGGEAVESEELDGEGETRVRVSRVLRVESWGLGLRLGEVVERVVVVIGVEEDGGERDEEEDGEGASLALHLQIFVFVLQFF